MEEIDVDLENIVDQENNVDQEIKTLRVKSNALQTNFIQDLQKRLNKSKSNIVVFDPYSEFSGDNNNCYLKPVIVLAPDFINGFSPICQCCNGTLSGNGWSTKNRYVHGLKHGFYILQKNFRCNNLNCKVTKIDTLSLFIEGTLPDYIACRYPIIAAGDTIFHRDLAGMYN
jgi:hypothetical protein